MMLINYTWVPNTYLFIFILAPASLYDGGYQNRSGPLYCGNSEEYYGYTYSSLISSCQRQLDLLKQLNEIRPPTSYGSRSYY